MHIFTFSIDIKGQRVIYVDVRPSIAGKIPQLSDFFLFEPTLKRLLSKSCLFSGDA